MRLTIIPSDNIVYLDNVSYSPLEWEGTPPNIHALQWFDSNDGWIEFSEDRFGNKKPNEKITELPEWASNAVQAWDEANDLANVAPVGE